MVFYLKVVEGIVTQIGYGASLPDDCIEKTCKDCDRYSVGDIYVE